MERQGFKSESEVESLGVFGDRMNENSANVDGIGGMQHALGAVAEQGTAEALPFVAVG